MARRKRARQSKRSRQTARPAPRRAAARKRARGLAGRPKKTRQPAGGRRKTAKPAARTPARKTARKATRKTAARPAAPAQTVVKQPRPNVRPAGRATPQPPADTAARRAAHAAPKLDRERRRLSDLERLGGGSSRTEADDRTMAAARTGHDEFKADLERHTETSPVLTAGDVDARWDDAYAVGDEAPGGDNPTPDQDRVDDIGKALGVVYEDNEELRAADKVADRDRHRWELDPASSDDWPHDEK